MKCGDNGDKSHFFFIPDAGGTKKEARNLAPLRGHRQLYNTIITQNYALSSAVSPASSSAGVSSAAASSAVASPAASALAIAATALLDA